MEKLFSVNENCLVYYEKETAKKIILLKNLDILFEEKDYVRIVIRELFRLLVILY